ncbi:MAG: outer membrane protein assembly factor BamD [Bdellovibrionia bacterium]
MGLRRSIDGMGRFLGLLALALMSSCSVDSAKNHYLLAEKLWDDGKYSASVAEFEKVMTKDPKGQLGLQATYRAAMTQKLFLKEFGSAIQKFQSFSEGSSDEPLVWEAQLQIGDILYFNSEQYDQAIAHYQGLLKSHPKTLNAPDFLFRIGKSHFFLLQFQKAIAVFEDLVKTYPQSVWAEKAAFELGAAYFSRAAQHSEAHASRAAYFKSALEAYERFIRSYPKSEWVSEARFGVASCLEELGQMEKAYAHYLALKDIYPAKNVIEIKLIRIRERMAQKKR